MCSALIITAMCGADRLQLRMSWKRTWQTVAVANGGGCKQAAKKSAHLFGQL
jgi:hypothetical protein